MTAMAGCGPLSRTSSWAGLTDAQPVSYLADLPDDPPASLLFIVPRPRVATVWKELRLRCSAADLEWEDASGETNVTCSRVGRKAMLITSWAHVLEGLLDAARAGEHDTVRHDILQLQGLTSGMDAEAFLPIRGDEITDQETARRLVNYSGLIEDIARELRDSGVADTQGLRPTHGWYTAGRYLRLHERFGLWLGIELELWSDAGITPLWAMLDNGDFSGVAGHHQTIRGLFDDAQLYEDAGALYIPIHLRTGVERDRVIDEAGRTDNPTCRHAAGQVSGQVISGFGGETDTASRAGNGFAVHPSSTMLKRSGCRVGFVPRLPPTCPSARPHAWRGPSPPFDPPSHFMPTGTHP